MKKTLYETLAWLTPNSVADLLREAKSLKSEHGENPEYDRALCELIGSLVAERGEMTADAARRVAKKIGIRRNLWG